MSCCGCSDSSSWSCTNPCSTTNSNTAACESLPSSLDNFIKHFFGSVIKTESNGQVTWSLPCNLAVGLPSNPRSADEGLACYFLRLFNDGIVGLTGPQGPAGNNGANGYHAFSVTLESFVHPAVGASITVKVYTNPAIQAGETVFIGGSGWYDVQAIGSDYTLVLRHLVSVSGATGNILAGRIVVVTGPQGVKGDTGATGIQGVQGPAGAVGDVYTPSHGFVKGVGANYSITLAPAIVTFGGTEPEVTLPAVGDYLIDVNVCVLMAVGAAASPGESIVIQVWNATAAAYEGDLQRTVQCFDPSQRGQIVTNAIVTTTVPNETLQLSASMSVAGNAVVVPADTTLRYVRLS